MSDSFEKAKILYNLGKFDRAAAALLEELAENPGNWQAHCHLVFCQMYMGHLDLALESAKEAVRLGPDWGWPHYTLAFCHLEMGQWYPAQKAINEALRINPQYHSGLSLAGRIAAHVKNWFGALEYLDRALELDPTDLETRNLKTFVLLQSGKSDLAYSFNEETLTHHPENGYAQMLMGIKLWEAGRGKEAEARLAEALRLKPHSESFRKDKILFHKTQNRFLAVLQKMSQTNGYASALARSFMILTLSIVFIESFNYRNDPSMERPIAVPLLGFLVFFNFMFWVSGPLSDFFLAFSQKRLFYPREIQLARWGAAFFGLSLLGIPLMVILSREWWVMGGFVFLLPLWTLFPVMGIFTLSDAKKRWIIYPLTILMAVLFGMGTYLLIRAVGFSPKLPRELTIREMNFWFGGIGLWQLISLAAIPMGYLVKKDD